MSDSEDNMGDGGPMYFPTSLLALQSGAHEMAVKALKEKKHRKDTVAAIEAKKLRKSSRSLLTTRATTSMEELLRGGPVPTRLNLLSGDNIDDSDDEDDDDETGYVDTVTSNTHVIRSSVPPNSTGSSTSGSSRSSIADRDDADDMDDNETMMKSGRNTSKDEKQQKITPLFDIYELFPEDKNLSKNIQEQKRKQHETLLHYGLLSVTDQPCIQFSPIFTPSDVDVIIGVNINTQDFLVNSVFYKVLVKALPWYIRFVHNREGGNVKKLVQGITRTITTNYGGHFITPVMAMATGDYNWSEVNRNLAERFILDQLREAATGGIKLPAQHVEVAQNSKTGLEHHEQDLSKIQHLTTQDGLQVKDHTATQKVPHAHFPKDELNSLKLQHQVLDAAATIPQTKFQELVIPTKTIPLSNTANGIILKQEIHNNIPNRLAIPPSSLLGLGHKTTGGSNKKDAVQKSHGPNHKKKTHKSKKTPGPLPAVQQPLTNVHGFLSQPPVLVTAASIDSEQSNFIRRVSPPDMRESADAAVAAHRDSPPMLNKVSSPSTTEAEASITATSDNAFGGGGLALELLSEVAFQLSSDDKPKQSSGGNNKVDLAASSGMKRSWEVSSSSPSSSANNSGKKKKQSSPPSSSCRRLPKTKKAQV